jgi:osomolarity two-component system response regulator SSK1
MQALIDFEGWRKWRGYEDNPRMIAPMRMAAAQAPHKLLSGQDDIKVAVASPGSSGSSSSRSEDTEVFPPAVQDAANGA